MMVKNKTHAKKLERQSNQEGRIRRVADVKNAESPLREDFPSQPELCYESRDVLPNVTAVTRSGPDSVAIDLNLFASL
jgi:hypothetical protein